MEKENQNQRQLKSLVSLKSIPKEVLKEILANDKELQEFKKKLAEQKQREKSLKEE